MNGGSHGPLRWFDGTRAVAGDPAPSSRIDVQRPSMAPILARIPDGHERAVHVDAGWDDILLELNERLAGLDEDYEVFQVTEKFGGLRYSCSIEQHPEAYRILAEAELEATRRCERCGRPGEINRETPAIRALCPEHLEEHVHDQEVLAALSRP